MNGKRIFSSDNLTLKLAEYEVALIRADLTRANPSIQKDLEKFGRSSVPVNVIGSGDPKEAYHVLEEVFGPGDVITALDRAAGE